MTSYLKFFIFIFVFGFFYQTQDFSYRAGDFFTAHESSLHHALPSPSEGSPKIRLIKVKPIALVEIVNPHRIIHSKVPGNLQSSTHSSVFHLSNFVSSGAVIFQQISTSC